MHSIKTCKPVLIQIKRNNVKKWNSRSKSILHPKLKVRCSQQKLAGTLKEKDRQNIFRTSAVQSDDGQITRNQYKILKEQSKFYKKLYKSNPDIQFSIENKTGITISEADKINLEQPISLDGMHNALKQMPSGCSPGCDG